MPNSKRWRDLSSEVAKLRKHFLPRKFDPLGAYPNFSRVQAHTRAFLVLSHAEIESYLEEWAKEIARACEVMWTSSGKVSEPLAFLLATLSDRINVPQTIVGPDAKDSPQRLVEASVRLFQRYYKQINDNHGIKETNVLALLAPLGVPAAALGVTLLPNLDSLGVIRGTHAHHSAKAVATVLDPETEFNRVIGLVNELTVLDGWFLTCRRRVR